MSSTTQQLRAAYSGRRVLVTGHTGFKGSWLCEWLLELGAEVTGYALRPPTSPSLFQQLQLDRRMQDVNGDILDADRLAGAVRQARPDYVFHLAAQPLVRASYADPVATLQTNVIGTAQVLEAVRLLEQPCAVVCVTTDKCYENREWHYGYRENDALGGHDPYSASKACAELVVSAYRRSFFSAHPVRLASARAGNVIGGGDWATDRIIPDAIRALSVGQPIPVRNRHATRPWQHVLEPLSGYLWLAARLAGDPALAGAFNFGPGPESDQPVEALVKEVLRHWAGSFVDRTDPAAPHEAGRLQLTTDRARALLQWAPVWKFPEAVAATVSWYHQAHQHPDPASVKALTRDQIAAYSEAARQQRIPWATEARP